MTQSLADAWEVMCARLPGLRRPEVGTGLRRDEVGLRLARIEAEVARDVEAAFAWDDAGGARLAAMGQSYRAGRFTTPAMAELEASVRGRDGAGRVTLSVLLGTHALTDVGMLQAIAAPGTLFQVASQFNCLEAPGPTMVRVADYVHDDTQGPRASVSAFPASLQRRYAAPAADGTRFTQTAARQINLLADAVAPRIAEVLGGYLTSRGVNDPRKLEEALALGFERIRVGLHDDVEVVFGGDWGGPVAAGSPTIAQVFTSVMALGGYSVGANADFDGANACLLRAAYLGTLLAALHLRKETAVLTLVGGGAFGAPPHLIWDALVWAVDRVGALAPSDLRVVVNARGMGPDGPAQEVRDVVGARGGEVVAVG